MKPEVQVKILQFWKTYFNHLTYTGLKILNIYVYIYFFVDISSYAIFITSRKMLKVTNSRATSDCDQITDVARSQSMSLINFASQYFFINTHVR